MRRGELLGLSHLALDLDGARLRVDRQLKADCTYGPPKSLRSERTIALDAETVQALRDHIATQRLARDLAGPAYEDHYLVFCDELGRRLRPGRISETFSRLRKVAGIPVGSSPVLRHAAATLALTATPRVPLHVVAGRFGDDPKTVLATYVHLLPHSDAMAADTGSLQAICTGRRRQRRDPRHRHLRQQLQPVRRATRRVLGRTLLGRSPLPQRRALGAAPGGHRSLSAGAGRRARDNRRTP